MNKLTPVLSILAIICLMAFMNLVTVNAYVPVGDGIYPVLHNCLPTGVGTYTNTTVDISLNYYLPKNSTQINSFSYSLDGASNSTLSYISKDGSESIVISLATSDFSKYIHYSIFGTLENLTNDNHTLDVYAYFSNGATSQLWSQTFRVNTEFVPPKLTVISPQNQSFYSDEVPLIFNTNSKVLWAYYTLDSSSSDNDNWIPFSGNMTLNGLSEGYHNLTISVKTEANTQSAQASCTQTVDFNFGSSQKNLLLITGNQANMILIAVIVAVIIAIVAVLLFKRNRS